MNSVGIMGYTGYSDQTIASVPTPNNFITTPLHPAQGKSYLDIQLHTTRGYINLAFNNNSNKYTVSLLKLHSLGGS